MSIDDGELFGWDVDRPWVWAGENDDDWALDLPPRAASLLARAATRGATVDDWLPNDLRLEIGDDDGSRPLLREELAELLRTAGATLSGADTTAAIEDERLLNVGRAAWMLCVLLHAIAQPSDDDAPPLADLTNEADVLSRLCVECERAPQMRVRPRRDGSFRLRWSQADRKMLIDSAAELRGRLESPTGDPATTRLFPSAYGNDIDRNNEWSSLTRDDLTASRLASLDLIEGLTTRGSANEAELMALMQSINSIRLVLGTQLEVSEETAVQPRRRVDPDLARFEALGQMQYEIIEALRSALP